MITPHNEKSRDTSSSIVDSMISSNMQAFDIFSWIFSLCWWYPTSWLQNNYRSFSCHSLMLPFILSWRMRIQAKKYFCVRYLVFCCYYYHYYYYFLSRATLWLFRKPNLFWSPAKDTSPYASFSRTKSYAHNIVVNDKGK